MAGFIQPAQDHRASLWQALSKKHDAVSPALLVCILAHLSQPLASSPALLSSCLSDSGRAGVSCSVQGHMQREGTQDKYHRETLFIASLLGSKSATSFHGTVLGHLCKGDNKQS